jgi:alpha-L-fucosidase 2
VLKVIKTLLLVVLFLPFDDYCCAQESIIWSALPATKWEDALPVGNGRLGAMVFGRTDEEEIDINEDTYWTGGPYSTVVKEASESLPQIQKLIFDEQYRKAHELFSRTMLGYPVEQQKYQPLARLVIHFSNSGLATSYRHQLDLDTAIATTSYALDKVNYVREVFATPVDQVIVVRIGADRPGSISFTAQLRGFRNTAHSNYATDYFQMRGITPDSLVLRGRSADYMGIKSALRYEARARAIVTGGAVIVDDDQLRVSNADSVTLLIAAATNFVSYKDVSADEHVRVETVMEKASSRSFSAVREDHIREHQKLFRRVQLGLEETKGSSLPTEERLKAFQAGEDPAFAALLFQFGRYLLITSSRPGSQPANLQGIWNEDSNPPWDSKYTTNINTEMNYWPAEVTNLSECAEPLFTMIRELTDQGTDVARQHYGASGWVFHQNTDIWRVAAPMDGASWGAFTTGGAWLATHLWEHYLYTGNKQFLRENYPILKGSAEFFLDFLTPHPKFGWLVTNPSTSPENFPAGPANTQFFDEITMMNTGTTLTAGSAIDMSILRELFDDVSQAAEVLGIDAEFRGQVLAARARLAPLQVGRKGNIQEWIDDWNETEEHHRHLSPLWGLYPGKEISPWLTPKLADASRVVLEQRGLIGTGWSSAWKAALWARLDDGGRALDNIKYAAGNYTTASLFSICSHAMQVDGALGMTAAIAEMLLQSQNGELSFLPALPNEWKNGRVRGLVARGGFEVGMVWQSGRLREARIKSRLGGICRIRISSAEAQVSSGGRPVAAGAVEPGVLEFATSPNTEYAVILTK